MNRPRIRVHRVHPISAMDNYDPHGHLAGWEAFDSARGEDTFKQLRGNLSKYEKKYNDLKKAQAHAQPTPYTIKNTIENKENEVRLPTIIHTSPLKRIKTNKQFCVAKNRNILQQAINYSDQHQEKFFKISRLFKIRRNLIYQEAQQIKKQVKYQRKPMVKRQMVQKSLVDYDFSDSRLHPRSQKAYLNRMKTKNEEVFQQV